MAFEIKMPQLGLTMTEGTVVGWLKKVGDEIKIGDPLVEISTDKLTNEVNSEAEGVLLAIVAGEGADVPVQGLLGYIGQAGESVEALSAQPAPPAASASGPAAPAPKDSAPGTPAPSAPVAPGGRQKISPLARKTAQKMGVDPAGLTGSGPGGRILQRDVLAAESAPKPAPVEPAAPASADLRREKLKGMRKVVAERMLASHLAIPCVTQNMKIDMTALMKFRATLNEGRDKSRKFSVNDLVLKAVAKALAQHKEILVSLAGDEIVYHDEVNIGMAVALDEGLIVPVIKKADLLGLEALSAQAKDLARRAREGGLTMDEYQGSTFSVSNLGMYGVETFTPIVNQPNAAILGVCAIEGELDLDEDGALIKKQVMRISLTFDHRLMDGAVAARFKMTIRDLLENPMSVLL